VTKKVFLGGTCNESKWREELIPMLRIGYYNPVVPDWTPECQQEELRQRATCDFVLYCVTPRMSGVYSIAEVVDDSNKRPEKAVFCILGADGHLIFSEGQLMSLAAVGRMVIANGGQTFLSLETCAAFLNETADEPEQLALEV
jgi:Nucleoside 2-deoxyribosyltransferase like